MLHGHTLWRSLLSILFPFLFLPMIFFSGNILAEDPWRVMTYNIRVNFIGDGENAWPYRKNKVSEMIHSRHGAQLVGLQEAGADQVADLVALLPSSFSWTGEGRDGGIQRGEFNPIFYRNDLFQLLQTKTFWLSPHSEIPGGPAWDAAYPRIVTWGKFKDLRTGKIFFHFNTHFDHKGRKAQKESARLLLKEIQKTAGNLPVIVTGDFNVRETSRPYAILTGKEEFQAGEFSTFSDARYLSLSGHVGPTATFVVDNFRRLSAKETKIDFLFMKDLHFQVLEHKVLDDKYDGRYPSDHLPVLGVIKPKL